MKIIFMIIFFILFYKLFQFLYKYTKSIIRKVMSDYLSYREHNETLKKLSYDFKLMDIRNRLKDKENLDG